MDHAATDPGDARADVGVVAIGRNEGERLKRCLRSVLDQARRVVYVDSGSTDGSVEFARSLGVEVVELDMDRPFTMARGRNAGFERLLERDPAIRFVQFVDGDCEVCPGWIERARSALLERPEVAAVSGRRREIDPGASIYNRLTDQEWDMPIGEVRQCGGDVMIRAEALEAVGGYNEAMIAGEEPELSVRLRRAGGVIRRLDAEMTLHDAAMTRWPSSNHSS
jgi:GT2 family glycosyltransferase